MSKTHPGTVCLRILAAAVLLVSAGCAYYNTFYLAKRYYREGQKEQDRSVSDVVAMGAATKFDQAARQCMKVVTEYPKSKWVDDATFLLGASLYGKGDYVGAIRRLDELEVKFPKSPFIPEGRLVKGLASYRRKDYATADSIFLALDAAHPKFKRRWDLYFYEGESRFAQRDYTGALGWYRRAIQAADGSRQKADALRRTGDALFEEERFDSAQVVYTEALKAEERPKQRLDVILRRAEALRDLKRYNEALTLLTQWRGAAIAEQREGEVLLRVYELQGLLGRTAEAMKGYQELVERYPGTNVAYESQFQIGYLYETGTGDLDRAAREYDKLRTMGGANAFAQQAQRRSQSLTTLKQYQQSLASDTTGARARTEFRLAEVLYFELGKTDSAMTKYRDVEGRFPNSVYAPKSAYARLWITAFDRKDTLAAMQLTDSIADRYRGTRYAESALYLWKQWSGRTDERTARFDALLANPDTSAAGRYADEPEVPAPAEGTVVSPTTAAPDSGYQVAPELMKKLEAERARLQKLREAKRKEQAPADTSNAAPSPAPSPSPGTAPSPTTAPPDTSRTAPADTTKSGTTR